MRRLFVIAACALLPFNAFAQDSGTPVEAAGANAAAPYAVAVETLEIGQARAGLMETGRSAAGYSFIARITGHRTNGLSLSRDAWRVSTNYRFVGADNVEVLSGVCRLDSEGRSLLGVQWDQRTSGLYACTAEGQSEGAYAMEVTLPAFRQASAGFGFGIAGISVGGGEDGDEPDLQAILRARASYEGVTYEATPTAFGREGFMDPRVVQGFIISRDAQPVGRIDFEDNSRNGGTITAPIADADGRRAVLYIALQLHAMPDLYSSTERERYLNR
jgi:hypothetical protein